MRWITVSIVLAGLFGWSLFSRQAALLTYVWVAIFRPLEFTFLAIYWMRPSLVAGVLLIVPSLLLGKFPNVTHPLSIGAWLMLGVVLVAYNTTYLLQNAWAEVDQFMRLVVVSTLAVTLLTTRQRLAQFVAVAAGSIGFYSAKGGFFYLLSGGGLTFTDGQAGAYADNNGYAMAVNMCIPLLIAAGATLRVGWPGIDGWIRRGFYLSVPFSVLTIIGTKSRGGLLALATLALVAAGLQRRPFVWTTGLVLTGALAYAVVPLPEGYLERMETISTYDEVGEESARGRLHFWRVAAEIAKSNPLGVGLMNYPNAYDEYDFLQGAYGPRRAVHSSHFQVLAELGYGGMAIWLLMFGGALWLCLRMRYVASRLPGLSDEDRYFFTTLSTAFAASMCAFIVGGAFLASATNDLTWLTFGAVTALHRQFVAERHAIRARDRVDQHRAAPVATRRPAVA